jgi:hypothetical protein
MSSHWFRPVQDGSASRRTVVPESEDSTMNSLRSAKFRFLAMAALLTWVTPPPAHADVLVNESIDFTGFSYFIPCAAGGAGELVVFTGELHMLIAFTANSAGGFHLKEHFQPQGLTGIGLTTGLKYQATGVTQEEINVNAAQVTTFVNNFKLIGQGPGNNFLVHENTHITINADGTVTASFDNLSVDCK